jgi:sulfate transport system substrate-binding protein
VRKGNPKAIKDWDDLVKDGVQSSRPIRRLWRRALNYSPPGLCRSEIRTQRDKNKQFIKDLYAHVPVLDTGARGSTTTFAQRGIGDVLLAWENEAFLALDELGADKFEIVAPSLSIKAEPPVAVVDKVVDAKGTRKVAEAYLKFLYTPEAQKLIAHNYYRPTTRRLPTEGFARFPT